MPTRYGLDGPGNKSRWARIFLQPSRLNLEPSQPPVKWVPGLLPRGKAAGAWCDHPPQSRAKVKEKVVLHPPLFCLYSLLWGEKYLCFMHMTE